MQTLLSIALLTLSPTFVAASPEPTGAAAPQIRLAESPEFYGRFLKGERFVRTIVVHNDGDAPLNIVRVTPKCSCSKIGEYDKVIAPGEKGEIVMEVDTNKIALGNQEKDVNIISDDPVSPRTVYLFRVSLDALVVPPLTLADAPESNATTTSRPRPKPIEGAVVRGLFDVPKQSTVILRSSGVPFEVGEIETEHGRCAIEDVKAIREGYEYYVTVSAPAASEAGETRDTLRATLRAGGDRTVYWSDEIIIRHHDYVHVEPAGGVQLLNKDTDPLLKENPAPVVRTLRVKGAEGRSFEILSTRLEGLPEGSFEVEVEPVTPGQDYAVKVILREYQTKVFLRGKLLIETSEPKVGTIPVKIQALFGKRR